MGSSGVAEVGMSRFAERRALQCLNTTTQPLIGSPADRRNGSESRMCRTKRLAITKAPSASVNIVDVGVNDSILFRPSCALRRGLHLFTFHVFTSHERLRAVAQELREQGFMPHNAPCALEGACSIPLARRGLGVESTLIESHALLRI